MPSTLEERTDSRVPPFIDFVVLKPPAEPTHMRLDAGALLGVAVAKQQRPEREAFNYVHPTRDFRGRTPPATIAQAEQLGLPYGMDTRDFTIWVPQPQRVETDGPARRHYRDTVKA